MDSSWQTFDNIAVGAGAVLIVIGIGVLLMLRAVVIVLSGQGYATMAGTRKAEHYASKITFGWTLLMVVTEIPLDVLSYICMFVLSRVLANNMQWDPLWIRFGRDLLGILVGAVNMSVMLTAFFSIPYRAAAAITAIYVVLLVLVIGGMGVIYIVIAMTIVSLGS